MISPFSWVKKTNAICMITKSGRYNGGTYAHEDIALEFASWISAEFKLYLILEFRRLKKQENNLSWNVRRELAKINYEIHTDAIRNNLIPSEISKEQRNKVYSDEADLLNVALFGKTAKEWRENNKNKQENIRDNANAIQLVCLANLEAINSVFIQEKLPQNKRIVKLNNIAIHQLSLLTRKELFQSKSLISNVAKKSRIKLNKKNNNLK